MNVQSTDASGEIQALRMLDRVKLDEVLVHADALHANPPAFRKAVTPLIRTPWGLMESINASLQRGRQS